MDDSHASTWMARVTRHGRLALKELRETLRDRRTIVTLILMPILVYPLLSMSLQRFLLAEISARQAGPSIVVLEKTADYDRIGPLLDLGVHALRERGEPDEASQITLSGPHAADGTRNAESAVEDGSADIGLRVRDLSERGVESESQGEPLAERRLGGPSDGRLDIDIIYRDEPISLAALERIERLLFAANTRVLEERLSRVGLPEGSAVAVSRRRIDAEPGASPLATLVPLVLILMTITGAVYPAIDLTAGERERSTLETLIAAPVSRITLLLSKYVAVVCVALLTATVNLAAMTITVQLAGFSPLLFGQGGISPQVVLRVFGLLVLFAMFFSAVLLSVTSMARSFKEAQAYLIPLMLIAITPGLLSMAPGLKLTAVLATVPLVNIVLVARDTFQQSVHPALGLAAVLMTLLYALAAIAFAACVFGTDSFLSGSKRTWSELWRRPARTVDEPPLGTAFFCLAVLYPSQFVLGGLIARAPGLALSGKLVAAAISTVAIFVGVPLLASLMGRVRPRGGLQLQRPPALAWLGAAVLGATMWPLAHAAFQWGAAMGLASLDKSSLQQVDELARGLGEIPIWLVVVTTGVVPGVCEELFFRGYLFTSLRRHTAGPTTVIITSVLFAAFHLVTPGMLAIERFLPSLVLGIILGSMALSTRSVWPGVVAHALHNGLLLSLVAFYQPDSVGPTPEMLATRLPVIWYGASIGGLVIGGGVFGYLGLSRPRELIRDR